MPLNEKKQLQFLLPKPAKRLSINTDEPAIAPHNRGDRSPQPDGYLDTIFRLSDLARAIDKVLEEYDASYQTSGGCVTCAKRMPDYRKVDCYSVRKLILIHHDDDVTLRTRIEAYYHTYLHKGYGIAFIGYLEGGTVKLAQGIKAVLDKPEFSLKSLKMQATLFDVPEDNKASLKKATLVDTLFAVRAHDKATIATLTEQNQTKNTQIRTLTQANRQLSTQVQLQACRAQHKAPETTNNNNNIQTNTQAANVPHYPERIAVIPLNVTIESDDEAMNPLDEMTQQFQFGS